MRKIMGLFVGLLMILTCFASIVNISTIGAETSGTTSSTAMPANTTTQKVSGPPNMLIDSMGPIRTGEGDFKIINAEGSVNSTRVVYIRSVQVLKYDVKEGSNHTISFKEVRQEIQQAPSTDAYTTQSSTVSLTSSTRTRADETTSQGMGTTVTITSSEKPHEPKIDKFIFVCPANWTIDSASMNFNFGKLNTEKTILTIVDPSNISMNVTPTFKLIKTNNTPVTFNEEEITGNIMIYSLKDIDVLKIIIKGELMNFMPGRFQSDVEFRKTVDERFGNKNGIVESVELEKFIKSEGSQIEQHTSGYDTGYNDGYKTGYGEGYNKGYTAGYNDGKQNQEKDYKPDYNPENNYTEKESLIMMDGLFPEMTSAVVGIVGAEGSISSNDAVTMNIVLSGKIPIDTTVDKHTVTLMKEFYSLNWDGPAFANVVYTTPDGWRVSPETVPANITPTNDGTTISFSTDMLKGPCKFVIIYNESAKAPIITKVSGTLYFTMTKINEFNMSVNGLDAIKTLGGELKTYSNLRTIIDGKSTATTPGFGNGDGVVNATEVKNFENYVATDLVKGDKAPPKSNEGVPIMIDGKFTELTTQKNFISGALNTAVTSNNPIQIGIKFVGRYYTESVDEHKVSLFLFRPEAQKDVKFKTVVVAVPSGWVIDSASKPSAGTLSHSNTVYTIDTNETKEDISFKVVTNKSSITPTLALENDVVYIIGYPNNTLEMMLTFDMLAMIRQKAATDPNSANITSYSDIRKIIDIAFGNNNGVITADEVAKIEEQMFKGQQSGQTQPSQQPTSGENKEELPIQIDGLMPNPVGIDILFENISGSVDLNTSFKADIKAKFVFKIPDKDKYVVGLFNVFRPNNVSVVSKIVFVTAPGWIIDSTTLPTDSTIGVLKTNNRVFEMTGTQFGVKFMVVKSNDTSVVNITYENGVCYIVMDAESNASDTRVAFIKIIGIDALILPVPETYIDIRREIDWMGNRNGMISSDELANYSAEICRRMAMGESADTSQQMKPEGPTMFVDGKAPVNVYSMIKLVGAVGSVTSNATITAEAISSYDFPPDYAVEQTRFADAWNITSDNFTVPNGTAQLPAPIAGVMFNGHVLEVVWGALLPTTTLTSPSTQSQNGTPIYTGDGYHVYWYEIDSAGNKVLFAKFNVGNNTKAVLAEPFKKTKIACRVVPYNQTGIEGPGSEVFFDFTYVPQGTKLDHNIQFGNNNEPAGEPDFDTFVFIIPNGWTIDNMSVKSEIRPYIFANTYVLISKAQIKNLDAIGIRSLEMKIVKNESCISPKLENISTSGSVLAVIMNSVHKVDIKRTNVDILKEMHTDSYSEVRKLIDSVEWAGNGDGYLSVEEVSIFEKMTINREVEERNEGIKDYEAGRKDGYTRGFEQGYYAGYGAGYNDGKNNLPEGKNYGVGYDANPKVTTLAPEERKEILSLKKELTVMPSENFDYIVTVEKKVLDVAGVREMVREVDKAGNRNDVVEQEDITNYTDKKTNVTTDMSQMPPIAIDDSLPVKKKQTVDVSALLGLTIDTTKSVTIAYTDNLTFAGIQAGVTHTIKGNVGEKPISAVYIMAPTGWEIGNVTSNLTNAMTIENKTTAKATMIEKDANCTITIVFNKLVPKFEVVDMSALPAKIVPGESFEISVKIKNNGTANGSITLSALGSISNWVAFEGKTSTEISLEPGNEISVTCKISVPSNTSIGGYTVTIVVGSEHKTLDLTITAKAAKKEGFIPGFEVAGFAVILGLVGLLARRRRK